MFTRAYRSIVSIFGRLFEALVSYHIVFDGGQYIFEGGGLLPVLEHWKVFDSPVPLADAGKVDFIIEFEDGGLLRIVRSALNIQTVDPVFEVGLGEWTVTL
jgi:hypothetical protein